MSIIHQVREPSRGCIRFKSRGCFAYQSFKSSLVSIRYFKPVYHRRCHSVRRRVFGVKSCTGRLPLTRRSLLCDPAGGDLLQILLASQIHLETLDLDINLETLDLDINLETLDLDINLETLDLDINLKIT